ncbi:MAG: NUDIX domain-containing protein [Candidatus Cybelea sp.]
MPESAIHLATGIAVSDDRLLMVASRYPNQPHPLWNLPGGRQQPGELLVETVVREFYEETQLRVRAGQLAYVSESYDGDRHFLNATFLVEVEVIEGVTLRPFDRLRAGQAQGDIGRPHDDTRDHVVAVEWVPIDAVRERVAVRVVREPLVAYLEGRSERRYAGYHDAGITIEWPADSL